MARKPAANTNLAVLPRKRPMPPYEALYAPESTVFKPAHDLASWLMETFIADGSPLENPQHEHLRQAKIGCLWTNVPNVKGQIQVVGQCEIMPPMAMGRWQRERAIAQIEGWFGELPDFLITFDAGFWAQADDITACAVSEHELKHAGQQVDAYGAPKFSRATGRPLYAIRDHDISTFVTVAERYGAVERNVAALVAAMKAGPTIGQARIEAACGTCAGKVAA